MSNKQNGGFRANGRTGRPFLRHLPPKCFGPLQERKVDFGDRRQPNSGRLCDLDAFCDLAGLCHSLGLAYKKKGEKGHFPEDMHLDLVAVVKKIIPSSCRAVFLGDGEFDGLNLRQACKNLKWEFVLRTSVDRKMYEL